MSGHSKAVDPYVLKSTDGFASKAKNVFDCLQTLEEKHQAFEKANKEIVKTDFCKNDPNHEDTETITPAFKAPRPVLKGERRSRPYNSSNSRGNFRSRGRMPDFNDGPKAWKKYSLEDVDLMDEGSNKQAAYAFLEERRKLREDNLVEEKIDLQSTACSKGHITFSKPKNNKLSDKSTTDQQNKIVTIDKEDEEMASNVEVTEEKVKEVTEDSSKVVFKSRKVRKSNIRTRDSDNNDELNNT